MEAEEQYIPYCSLQIGYIFACLWTQYTHAAEQKY